MVFRLRNREYRLILLEAVRVDRNIVSLWRLSNTNDTDAIQKVDSPPNRRPSNVCYINELRNCELRVVGVS